MANCWSVSDLAAGRFDLLNSPQDLGNPVRWDPAGVTQLWSFHLNYWEWAWALAAAPDQRLAREAFADHLDSWTTESIFGRWDAWAPYPASLRAWVLVNVHQQLASGSDIEPVLIDLIGLHGGFLEHNMELDVGGNHMIKNIKGLLGCAVFLGDSRLLRLALRYLDQELRVQILPDGGHYELSPSYHCQVLADLLDMSDLLSHAGQPSIPFLQKSIQGMRDWLGEMLLPDGSLPLFNDSTPVDIALLELLNPSAPARKPLSVLADSGYAIVRTGRIHLVADVGQPGPNSPPGHIHADCLSFTLYVDDLPVVVDTGTSEYGSGPRRAHERSTAAHNTVEIDGTNQTEVFGAFRAGRRARTVLDRAEVGPDRTVTITATHDGYRHLSGRPIHRRTWVVNEETVLLTDDLTGSGRHQVVLRLHRPETATSYGSAGSPTDVIELIPDAAVDHLVEPCALAADFGLLKQGRVEKSSAALELPAQLVTRIQVVPQPTS